jgi:hypothetical protein
VKRRSFLKAGSAVALAAGFRTEPLWAHVPTHNFDKYDFGAGPPVSDRPYQGPFSADDYPRQAKFPTLPKGTNWKGLRLRAEIGVKGQRYPVCWACGQKLNDDGSLTLRPNAGLGQNDEAGGVSST